MEPKIRKKILIIFLICIIATTTAFYFKNFVNPKFKPNIVIVTLDALRPDHLGCYGYKRNTSPNIDKIAKEGVLFLNTIAQSSWTVPSLPSILTSNYLPAHEVVDFGDKISEKLFTLTYLLKINGYQTGFFSNNYNISTILRFDEHFDSFYTVQTYKMNFDEKWNIKKGESKINIANINHRVIKWIKENRRKRFFLWVHYLDPHNPMNPPLLYKKMFINDNLSKTQINVPISNDDYFGRDGIPHLLAKANSYITDLNYYISIYDGAIRYTDDLVGELVENFKKMNLDKKTLFIISSDHGEGLGEHNFYFTHGTYLYDELIKVPLIIKFDKLTPKGKTIVTQVQHIDIAPTILQILGIRKPRSMVGLSLIPLIKEKDIYAAPYAFSFLGGKGSIRNNEWKLIYNEDGGYELYNLKKDPTEKNNLVSLEKEEFENLKEKLDNYMNQLEELNARRTKPVLEEKQKERLKSLGYL